MQIVYIVSVGTEQKHNKVKVKSAFEQEVV
jgi:hypothetical protein